MSRTTWEDVAGAATNLATAAHAFLSTVREATDNSAFIAAAEHVATQVGKAAHAGQQIASLMHKVERLADFESGRVVRNPSA